LRLPFRADRLLLWLSLLLLRTLLRPLGLLTARLLTAAALTGGTLRRAGPSIAFGARFPCPLLELCELLFHETTALRVAPRLAFVETAIWTPLPPFRVGLAAGGTENAFWERHRESARIVHFDPL
jgi:hypothetical protein